MQGKKSSKIPSLLQKGVLAKEKFNLDRKLRKKFANMTNYFATSHYYSKKNHMQFPAQFFLFCFMINIGKKECSNF